MAMNPTVRRRWLGACSLAVAILMLLGGEILLPGRLHPAGFLLYWLVCFGFTGLAICIALLDAQAIRRRTHAEERELWRATFQRADHSESASPSPPPRPAKPGRD